MAEGAPTPTAKGGFLKNLSPKQKRYAAVIGGAALLALIYLVTRNRGGEEGATPSDPTTATESAVPASVGGAGESGSAFTGAESEQISERLGEVGTGLTGVNEGLGEIGGGLASLGEGQQAIGEGQQAIGDSIAGIETSIAAGQDRTAAALGKQNRAIHQVSKQLHNKAAKRRPNSDKAGTKHTAGRDHKPSGAGKSGGGAKGGGGKKTTNHKKHH